MCGCQRLVGCGCRRLVRFVWVSKACVCGVEGLRVCACRRLACVCVSKACRMCVGVEGL